MVHPVSEETSVSAVVTKVTLGEADADIVCVADVNAGGITDEGVAGGGAFGSDTAAGLIPVAHRVAGVRSFR